MTTAMRTLVVATVLLVGCKDADLKPCKRGATFEVRVVDNDSPYMKKVFRLVGSDRNGQPSDPAAQAAGIRAEVDQWSHDTVTDDGLPTGGKRYTDYYLYAHDSAALTKYVATLEPPPGDREIKVEPSPGIPDAVDPRPLWRTFLVEKTPMLTTDHVGRVNATTTELTENIKDLPIVLVELTPAGRDAFAKGTAAVVGRKVAVMIDGEIVNAPIIQAKIPGGKLSIRMSSPALANELATKLACVK
jgi:hypothetical protein